MWADCPHSRLDCSPTLECFPVLVYLSERTDPHFSIRPSGFEFWPGLIAAIIAGYIYLLRRALDPVACGCGPGRGRGGGNIVLGISGFATGTLLGTLSSAPWALPYFGEMRHPVGLYQALANTLLLFLLWGFADARAPRAYS